MIKHSIPKMNITILNSDILNNKTFKIQEIKNDRTAGRNRKSTILVRDFKIVPAII